MKVTSAELRRMDAENVAWKRRSGEHPTAYISDDLFDRILEDLHELARLKAGQGELELGK